MLLADGCFVFMNCSDAGCLVVDQVPVFFITVHSLLMGIVTH
jgi:hypothetical protein